MIASIASAAPQGANTDHDAGSNLLDPRRVGGGRGVGGAAVGAAGTVTGAAAGVVAGASGAVTGSGGSKAAGDAS